jgi:hypothetical protein
MLTTLQVAVLGFILLVDMKRLPLLLPLITVLVPLVVNVIPEVTAMLAPSHPVI